MTDEIQKPKIEIGDSKVETEASVVIIEEPSTTDHPETPIAESVKDEPLNHQLSVTLPMLLEVGCEEIPARFLSTAQFDLGFGVIRGLQGAALVPSEPEVPVDIHRGVYQLTYPDMRILRVETYSTPRRLAVYVPALPRQQPDRVEEILGPPIKVAIDAEGNYTRAAESFAQKNSARVEDLARTTTPKGEYLSLRKTTPGRPTLEILAEILPGAILGLTFPKSMYWTEKSAPRFVRPIRWIVAILGEGKLATTIDFNILGVKSGSYTFGHRAKSGRALSVRGFKDYVNKLSRELVDIDYSHRLKLVVEGSLGVGASVGRIVPDEWLMDWIANSTEWPHPMLGSFDERFLGLPREILITVMRDHQRYFAVEDEQGNLRPNFVVVLNMDSDEKGLIRQGHQRVLTARFRDAEFFWNADQKIPLRDRAPLLEKVTYQAKLGSYADKIKRVKEIAENICATLEQSGALKAEQVPHVQRAVELCKCDLTTHMVQEFTELQGIVGGLYAKVQGEPEEVSTAIYDHYLPAGAEGNSPRTLVGAIVSLADKLDSVVAGFAAGYEPTGSSDPFALRRQANGIIKVILECNLSLNLKEAASRAIEVLDVEWRKSREEVLIRVLDFFAERLRYYFESVRGFRYDTVRAVVAAGADQPADAQARAEAMEALRGGEDFEALSAAAKRIRNILAKSATQSDWSPGEVDENIFAEVEERDLYREYKSTVSQESKRSWRGLTDDEVGRPIIRAKKNPQAMMSSRRETHTQTAADNYRDQLERISTLRPAVDLFFDKVLVMAEDREVRQNRLRLLKKLDQLFSGIADFAEIAQKQ